MKKMEFVVIPIKNYSNKETISDEKACEAKQ